MSAVATAHVRKHRVASATRSGWGSLKAAESPPPPPTAPAPTTNKEIRMAKRRSKAEIRKAIVSALDDEPKGIGQLEKDTGIKDGVLRRNIADLIAHGLAAAENPGQYGSKYKLTGKDPADFFKGGNGAAPPPRKLQRKTANPKPTGAERQERQPGRLGDRDLNEAFKRLGERIGKPAVTITDLKTKLAVLDRLAELVDPSISRVLSSIGCDLKQAGVVPA